MLISKHRKASFGGMNLTLTVGAILIGLSASVFAIDLPFYFTAQNQLQTAVDAAALAGASALPEGEQEAQNAASEIAYQNEVAGQPVSAEQLSYTVTGSSFEVTGKVQVPTIMGNFLCGLSGKHSGGGDTQNGSDEGSPDVGGGGGGSDTDGCSYMTVYAHSKGVPAARDTVLVIDTSSSMDDLGNQRPFKDVKSAAKKYIDLLVDLDSESVDRVSLVTFDKTGK